MKKLHHLVFALIASCFMDLPAFGQTAVGEYNKAIARAGEAATRHDMPGMERALQEAIQCCGGNASYQTRAEFALGDLYRDWQRYGDAYKHYQNAYVKSPNLSVKQLAALNMARCQFACGQYGASQKCLALLAGCRDSQIATEAKLVGALNDYFCGRQRQAFEVVSSTCNSRNYYTDGKPANLLQCAECLDRGYFSQEAALVYLKLFEDEKRRKGAASKEANDLAFHACKALSQSSKFSAEYLLATMMGSSQKSSAQDKLKIAALQDSIRNTCGKDDEEIVTALKLSLQQYGPEHQTTVDIFNCNVHHMKSFSKAKQMADMMIQSCKSSYGENSLKTIKWESELARLYREAKQDDYGNELYKKCLAKLEHSGDQSNEALHEKCSLNGLIGLHYAQKKDYALADHYLQPAAEAAENYSNVSFRVCIIEGYLETERVLGKTEKVKWAEAELKDAMSKLPVLETFPGCK